MSKEDAIVKTRKLTATQWLLLIGAISVATVGFGYGFQSFGGTQPYIDALTLVVALFGQMLMVYRFREQWLLWGTLNVASIYQWFTLGNMSLVALYVAFLINVIYGYVNWNKQVAAVQSERRTRIEIS